MVNHDINRDGCLLALINQIKKSKKGKLMDKRASPSIGLPSLSTHRCHRLPDPRTHHQIRAFDHEI
jgi:hypothetical protein